MKAPIDNRSAMPDADNVLKVSQLIAALEHVDNSGDNYSVTRCLTWRLRRFVPEKACKVVD